MVYMFLGTGFEETEAVAPLDLLRRAGVEVKTVGLNGKVITGSHGIPITADLEIGEISLQDLEMVILPGGLGGVASIRGCKAALDLIRYAWNSGAYVAAICAGPTVLADLGITEGKNATCYPSCTGGMGSANIYEESAVRDGRVITGASAGCAVPFGLKLIEALKGEAEAMRIASQIVIR